MLFVEVSASDVRNEVGPYINKSSVEFYFCLVTEVLLCMGHREPGVKLGNKGKLSSLPALSHHSGAQTRTQLSEVNLSHRASCERYFLGGKTDMGLV